eukprot:Blabericola_migrator_1__7449@NODE_379_length_9201_cov_80_346179_g303_i0_p2_GENE_NODE_379_length_9201_cov_80_346179_g303_i0NODE_379_length_9201_cov_80_346179_g303_i0_p2_ORF_typecomplete_len265_score40_23Metallophos_2/PF12850_7/0_29_NODE_379_length_9201_cov_80_346179_g303_i020814
MGREWILILGDLGIPELAAELPETFENLIKNLRSSPDKKHVACTGNLGSSGPAYARFLRSLTDNEASVHLLRGYLPSCPSLQMSEHGVIEKDFAIFKAGTTDHGVSIGMFSPYVMPQWPSKDTWLSSPDTLAGCHCDIVICNNQSGPNVVHQNGTTFLCPGSATGTHIFVDAAAPPYSQHPVLNKKEEVSLIDADDTSEEAVPMESNGTPSISEENPALFDGAAFMLLSVSDESLILYNYKLIDNDLKIEQIDIPHPRPIAHPE